MGTYSVDYFPPEEDLLYLENAVDWDYHVRGQWSISGRDRSGCAWQCEKGLDTHAYKALLAHFGLEQWAEEFPPERIISMSPRELAEERRRKEETGALPKKEMASDTLGYNVRAEDHSS